MKKLILPAAIVLIVAAISLSMGSSTGESQSALVGDSGKECTQTAVMASSKECGDKVTTIAARLKECGEKTRAIMASEKKECGSAVTATKASTGIECPYRGTVLKAADEKSSCSEKTAAVHASAEKVDQEEACCEKHEFAMAE